MVPLEGKGCSSSAIYREIGSSWTQDEKHILCRCESLWLTRMLIATDVHSDRRERLKDPLPGNHQWRWIAFWLVQDMHAALA